MANIFLREPIYITVQSIRDTTSKTALLALTDDEIKVLISKAEDSIDNYIIRYWTKFDEDQDLIFPVNIENVSVIPNEISVATYYSVEQIFVNADTIIGSTTTWNGEISSESTGDRKVTYNVGTTTNWNLINSLWLPNEAIQIISKYRKVFYKSKI